MFTYGSVCSGIEAASAAWEPLGFQAAWFAEIEPFPAARVAGHDSDGVDVTLLPGKILRGEIPAPDILVGGTPCQAFSVAGLRGSLDDARGNLTLVLVRILDAIDFIRQRAGKPPCIIVWENVPGVLSTKDNAFGCFLGALAGEDVALEPAGKKWTNAGAVLGHQRKIAWRTLDAQFFGVPQRRRRVFVVAGAGAIRPHEILFERQSGAGNFEPGRTPPENLAADAGGGSHWDGQHLPHPTLNQSANTGGIGASNQEVFSQRGGGLVPMRMCGFGDYVSDSTASTVKARDYKDATDLIVVNGRQDPITSTIAQPLDVQKQTNVVCIKGNIINRLPENGGNGLGVDDSGVSYTLTATDRHAVGVFKAGQGARAHGIGYSECLSPTLTAAASGSNQVPSLVQSGGVRRLMPVECERLQGFPDNHTQIPWRGKSAEECPDGPRYKAIGNSMAVPVMRWIGRNLLSAGACDAE